MDDIEEMVEKLSEIILDFFKNIGLVNELMTFIIGIFAILIFEKCKKKLELSSGELLFMKKKNEVYRNTILGVFILMAISLVNYLFIKEDNLRITLVSCVVLVVCSIVLAIKKKNLNVLGLSFVTAFGLFISYCVYSQIKTGELQISAVSMAIISAIIDTLFILFIFANSNNSDGHKAKYYIKENDKPWYIYRIMDEKTMLCGDDIDSWNNTQIKLFKYDSNTLFYKVESLNKKEKQKKNLCNEEKGGMHCTKKRTIIISTYNIKKT